MPTSSTPFDVASNTSNGGTTARMPGRKRLMKMPTMPNRRYSRSITASASDSVWVGMASGIAIGALAIGTAALELGARRGGGHLADRGAVPEHRDPATDLRDLFEVVGDEDDRGSLVA